MNCPNEQLLERFALGLTTNSETERAEHHLAECPSCQSLAADLMAVGSRLGEAGGFFDRGHARGRDRLLKAIAVTPTPAKHRKLYDSFVRLTHSIGGSPMMRRFVWSTAGLAAAAMVVLAVMLAKPASGMQEIAAQVINKVKEANSVEFVLSHGPGEHAAKEKQCVLQREKLRVQHPNGIVMIADLKTKEFLYLDPKNKTAGRFPMHEHVATELATNPIEQLRQVRSDGAERVGKEVVDGTNADVFRVRGIKLFGAKSDKGEMRVWVDSASMLPLKIELRIGLTPFLTFKKMKWNLVIDPSLLSMEIPDAYAVQSEEALRKLLRPDADEDKGLTPTEAFRKKLEEK